MGLIDDGKKVLAQTLERFPHFVIFLGVLILFFSFTTYENGFHFPQKAPNWIFFAAGIIVIIAGIVLHFVSCDKKMKKLVDGTTIKFNSTILTIKIGDIQNEEGVSKDSAFVLPANTTFADDCVTDINSALGSFFNKHHAEKIPSFSKNIQRILKDKRIPSNGGNYESATVLILPDEYSIQSKVILIASSERSSEKGFNTTPSIISNSIYNLFEATAEQRIRKFYIPIIGSGHAGLEITEALNLMILCIKFHSRQFHHPSNITIFVRKKDKNKINASFLNYF